MTVKSITVNELLAMRHQGIPIVVLDVRTPVEFREIHAEGARSIPLDRLDPTAVMAGRNSTRGEPLYVICQSGNRARQACDKFEAAGLPNAVLIEGGTQAWKKAGGPIVRGKKAVSLERQVRILAGCLVLLGAGLALTVNLWFVLLSAFIGAGLVFAGITDTCGRGMLLARMPWNQLRNANPTCCTH